MKIWTVGDASFATMDYDKDIVGAYPTKKQAVDAIIRYYRRINGKNYDDKRLIVVDRETNVSVIYDRSVEDEIDIVYEVHSMEWHG